MFWLKNNLNELIKGRKLKEVWNDGYKTKGYPVPAQEIKRSVNVTLKVHRVNGMNWGIAND